MTTYIGDVAIPSIQNFTLTRSKEIDELDITEKNTNILLTGAEDIQEIEIDFTLIKNKHPDNLNIEEQRLEIKKLIQQEPWENIIQYNNNQYFLSVESVSIPESGELKNIRRGTINAKAFPYPKYDFIPVSGLYPVLQSVDRAAQIDAQLEKGFGSDS